MPVKIGTENFPGLVLDVTDLKQAKQQIRTLGFTLKKLACRPTGLVVAPKLIKVVKNLSNYYMLNMAQILNLVLPSLDKIKVFKIHTRNVQCRTSSDVKNLCLLTAQIDSILISGRPGSYRPVREPSIDLREYVKAFAEYKGAKYQERREGDSSLAEIEIITVGGKTIFSPELVGMIRKAASEDASMFLAVARRGFATFTICSDCGELLSCKNCKAPLVLRQTRKEKFYKCNHCGKREDVRIKCYNCDSWKLAALGIGTERVKDELANIVGRKLGSKIKIGTLSDISKIREHVNCSAVVSIDSLFSLPDFNMREKIFYDLMALREVTSSRVLVQTKHKRETVFDFVEKADVEGFRQDEMARRRALSYPPFSVFIKITHKGTDGERDKFVSFAKELLKDYNPIITDAFIPIVAGKFLTHAILRLPTGTWPNESLRKKLELIQDMATISVDPENLL